MKLNYNKLYESNKIYGIKYGKYNRAWMEAQKIQWNLLYDLPDSAIRNDVLNFLNKFGCRIHINSEVIQGIKIAHRDTIPYIDALKNENLWNLKMDKEIIIYNKNFIHDNVIYTIFDAFSNIGHRFSHVAASKLLHQINPFIFMMWDNGIIKHYEIKKNSNDYVYKFLPLMKEKLNQFIKSYMEELNINRDKAIIQLNKYKKHKTILKLLDEYNWLHNRSLI